MNPKPEKSKPSDKPRLKKRPKFISGIHNYCDRWCERCRFTERCRVYYSEQKYKEKHPYEEDDADAFFAHLSHIFGEISQMIEKNAVEMGIDLDEIKKEAKTRTRGDRLKHPVVEIADQYGKKLHEWLNQKRENIRQTAETLVAISEVDASKFVDSIEVVSWYMFFIAVKLSRAFGKDDPDDEFERYDMLGTAKIAIIAIERAIAAHSIILGHMPEEEDSLLWFLTRLEKVRRSCNELFPDAMDFIRPGLDEQ
jgi:hypothetical protein